MLFLFCVSAGSDYISNSVTAYFNTGDELPCLNITILNDTEREPCETFNIGLTTTSPPEDVTVLPAIAVVTIYDDEG